MGGESLKRRRAIAAPKRVRIRTAFLRAVTVPVQAQAAPSNATNGFVASVTEVWF